MFRSLALIVLLAAAGTSESGTRSRNEQSGSRLPVPGSPLAVTGSEQILENDAAIVHALNRLTYGPRPGDVERVRAMGLEKWIETQLATEGTERAENTRAAEGTEDTDQTKDLTMREPATDAQRKNWQIIAASDAKLRRAVYSERQLEEVLVDFWFNHFNVFAAKGQTRNYIAEYERDAIRPYVLGNFRDMLGATAKSSAMLFYLDNWLSTAPGAEGAGVPSAKVQGARRSNGINENYARELLELHTLGVDGGYTQDDIVNVAKAFTGWTMRPKQGTGFVFAPARHDRSKKVVLGKTIKPGGVAEGEQVLDIVAAHLATARHIATKLAVRFVSDNPPASLIDRAAAKFTATHGDLREVVRTIITSPEFASPAAYRAKVKTPLEFVASALRATGADVRNAMPLVKTLREMGMPLFLCQPPTGYDDTATTWVSAGALVSRMNFAVELSKNAVRGVRVPLSEEQALAMKIGSPEFQRQ
jgi:uncharacterized protein (DUF1800 family)